MQIRPFLIKLRLKFKALGAEYRPRLKPRSVDAFFQKHWKGNLPVGDFFTENNRPRFFFAEKQRDKYTIAINKQFSAKKTQIIESAEKIIANRFDLLGSGEMNLGDKIDWQLDFKSGFKWPLEYYAKIKIVDLTNDADVKVPWELSRLQFLTGLGRAHWLTNERKYKDKFVDILSDWDNKNPIEYGVNWSCSMEIAIRAINIVWGLHFFGNGGKLTAKFVSKIIRLLYYHGVHIERNLEIIDKGSNSNHLISNYLGLFYLAVLFPEFDKSQKWLTLSKKGLEQEISLQINSDGADYECSTSYHRLVFEIFLSAFLLGKQNEIKFSEDYISRLTKICRFSTAMTPQSGKVPLIGDNDDGFIVKLSNDDPHDHRALLDIASQELDIKVPDNVEPSEERLWYLGPNSLNRWPKMARRRPSLFKDTGYGIIQNDKMHLVLNACGIPEKYFGGHKHNDLLSLNLEINQTPLLIDAGTACYSSDYKLRNKSRTTSMHNTICIDNEEQCRIIERALFFMFNDARPRIDLWTVTEDKVIVSAVQNGFRRLRNKVIHRRTLEIALNKLTIDIWDEITGDGNDTVEHLIESRFLTPWNCTSDNNSNVVSINSANGDCLSINFNSDSKCHLQTVPMDYHPRYGAKAKGTQICCRIRTKLPFKLETRLRYRASTSHQHFENRISSIHPSALKKTIENVK